MTLNSIIFFYQNPISKFILTKEEIEDPTNKWLQLLDLNRSENSFEGTKKGDMFDI